MKAFKIWRQAAALVTVLALFSGTFTLGVKAQRREAAGKQKLNEEQRILHVLNRLGYGARPGDVERVRRMGVERYVEEQFRPEKIADEVADAKVKNLSTLTMSNAELLAKYPNPGMLIRKLQRSGELPPELATIVENRLKGMPQTMPNSNSNQAMEGEAMSAPGGATPGGTPKSGEMTAADANADPKGERKDYRKAIIEYMRANNLEAPQRITAELQAARIMRAVYSERQLQEVLVDFWSNHFNIFAGKGVDRWFLTSFDRDTIRPHTMGKFRDLLGATAESPAMLFYLDNFQSVSPSARPANRQERRRLLEMMTPEMRERLNAEGVGGGRLGRNRNRPGMNPQQREAEAGQMNMPPRPAQQRRARGINENYARELMELHTLGVDGGYTQRDVQEVARAFTGWTLIDPRGYLAGENSAKFNFNPRLHDDGEKTVLGHKIPAGGGIKDGEMVLDILSRHPSTAKFIATKLARRFVADNPPPLLVERAAAVFTKTDGDIRETLRAIFTSPEFNSAEARRAKIKTPFELAISAVRTLGGETDGRPQFHAWVSKMGEPLYMYQAPTGYPDTAEHWVNTGALLERLNFALALVGNRIPGTRVDLARFAGSATKDEVTEADRARLVDQFLGLIVQGDVSPKTKETLMKQLNDPASTTAMNAPATPPGNMEALGGAVEGRRNGEGGGGARRAMRNLNSTLPANNPEVARIAALILGTPEFQRQ